MTPIVIAHRGASGYLPEHTLAAKVLAYAMGADYLEQDVVATRDDELVVLHDIHADRISDIAEHYPGRARTDGRFYVRDFDLGELRELNVWERFNPDGSAVYPGRYPVRSGHFRIHTLGEEVELVQELNRTTGGSAGLYPEIKKPAWHRSEGVDLAPRLLDVLGEYGYTRRSDKIYVQCFDAAELRRIRNDIGSDLKLVQLLGDNSWGESSDDYDDLRGAAGLAQLARIADGIGPSIEHCYHYDTGTGRALSTGLIEQAHALGMLVHPYTIRQDSLPTGFSDLKSLLNFCLSTLKVDGLFTDFPDTVRALITAPGQ
jgi:glycerophosphoryl diester phosphodiesterase